MAGSTAHADLLEIDVASTICTGGVPLALVAASGQSLTTVVEAVWDWLVRRPVPGVVVQVTSGENLLRIERATTVAGNSGSRRSWIGSGMPRGLSGRPRDLLLGS